MSSGRSSPVNGGFESAGSEPTGRLSVRKDLFPDVRLSKLTSEDDSNTFEGIDEVSCVNLKTDFEQSIDEIQKLQTTNGIVLPSASSRHKKHKHHSSDREAVLNGTLPATKRKKSMPRESHRKHSHRSVLSKVKGGKNLNLVSSSEFQESDEVEKHKTPMQEDQDESSEDEVLKCSVKLPILSVKRASGKPYSHELSQLSHKKSKSKDSNKEQRIYVVQPCSGKPRSMLDICSSSKKKSKKSTRTVTYQSSIVDTNTNLKIKIRRTSRHEVVLPTPIPITKSISDIGQRKSKKKRAASPVASESSGEEYDPSRAETTEITVATPKPRHPPSKAKKSSTAAKHKGKKEKTEKSRVSAAASKDVGPQSPWGQSMPEEILVKIFENVVNSEGSLPSVIRLGRVCKLWNNVSCRPELWRVMDLAQYTIEKFKTDYKLVWLLENRMSQCRILNIAHWKVGNVPWVLACVADYCPSLTEISIAGWSRLLPEQLFELFQSLPSLQRIDMSHTSEISGSGSCLSAASVARVVESFGARITHLTLANNRFSALQQILTSISMHCPNLEVLDISGALVTSHPGAVPLEALQKGCPKVRVFRAANAQLVLASATTAQQMETEGWSFLEELSIAGDTEAERGTFGKYRLGDEALSRLVRGATRLRLLDLRGLQQLSDSGLVRVPAWDLQHLFLGGSNVIKKSSSCLELICEKWSHSLIELDLSWASAARALDDAVAALADATDSKLKILNLCGSSVSLEAVKKVLRKCLLIESLNLSSCRAIPRGMKRLLVGKELQNLKDSFDPTKPKTNEEDEDKKDCKKQTGKDTPKQDISESATTKSEEKLTFQEPKSVSSDKQTDISSKVSPNSKSTDSNKEHDTLKSPSTPKHLSPAVQSKPDSSSTPRSETSKTDIGSPTYSPLSKPDSQVQTSPDLSDSYKGSNSWSLGQFKTTPTHRSEASPINKSESHAMMKPGKSIEQCSPTTSQENKPSPETLSNYKQDSTRTPNSYYGGFSPMTRQESQFSSQRSPYSAQPSPVQPTPSPYSAQPSPYSTQPSPYSSQPSPYSAQPSPDTSQIGKPELQKSSAAWSTGSYSPMPKHPAPFSPHPSPEPSGKAVAAGRTPAGQHLAPFSPHPSPESAGKGSAGRTPAAQYPSPFSPHPSPEAGGKALGSGRTPSSQYPGTFSPHPSPEAGGKALGSGRTPSSQYTGTFSPHPSPEAGGKAIGSGRTPSSQYPGTFSPHPSPEAGGKALGSGRTPSSQYPGTFSPHPSPEAGGKALGSGRTPSSQYTGTFSPHPSPEAGGKALGSGRTPSSQYPGTFSPHPSPEAGGKAIGSGRTPSSQYPGTFSPHPSPEPPTKNTGRTPSSQYPGPYSPRTSDKKSPAGQPYSPLMRGDCLPPTAAAATDQSRQHYSRASHKQDVVQNLPLPEMPANWGVDRYNRMASNIDPVSWRSSYQGEDARPTGGEGPPQPWSHLPPFEPPQEDLHDPWALGQFRMEPPHQNNYMEQPISFEQLSAHIAQQPHLQSFIEENFPETSRVD